MNTKYALLVFATLFLGVFSIGHSLQAETTANINDGKINIVTTTAHIGDLVRNIGGEHVTVTSLMGPGVDPHLYRPVRSDIVKLSDADMIFYNGRHLEGQMDELFERLSEEKPVYGIAYYIENLITDEDGAYDPHVWMDVESWIEATNFTTEKLIQYMPENKDIFTASANLHKAELKNLHSYIQTSIASIPENNRTLITSHDAFGYLGSAYGLDVIGIQGLSTASEAGLHKIEKMVSFISNKKIPAIFTESSVSDRNIRAIKEGVIANGHDLKIGGTLYSDSLGAADTYTGTYIGMMKHNVHTITNALGGNVVQSPEDMQSTLLLER